MDKKKRSLLLRTVVGGVLSAFGLFTLGCVTELPTLDMVFRQTIAHPTFLRTSLPFPLEEDNSYDFFTQKTIGQYAWLSLYYSDPSTEENLEREASVLPPTPQPVIQEDEGRLSEGGAGEESQAEDVPSPTLSGDWVQKTMTAGSTHVKVEDIYVANSGKVSVEGLSVPTSSPISLEIGTASPQILIYHSHGTESYTPTAGYEYTESDPYRTTEEGRNILVVGEAMAEVFREAGYSVIHDTNFHDYPDYTQSYANSSVTISQYLEDYPSLELIFDVHRDALSDTNGTPYQLVATVEGEEVAQVMLVVGSNGDGYAHPNWRENFALALTLQQGLLGYGEVARPVTLRSSRFNQHLSTGALLVEVGGHGNTLEQAVAGGRLFAQSVVDTLG